MNITPMARRTEHARKKEQHGHGTRSKTPTYRTWQHMLARCHSKNDEHFPMYGGRGISVCSEWRVSFNAFLRDMGERPKGKTLDRFPDKNGNYELTNCRWATVYEQAQNTSRAKLDQTKVSEILAYKGLISSRKLAPVFGVSNGRISAIWRGVAWRRNE